MRGASAAALAAACALGGLSLFGCSEQEETDPVLDTADTSGGVAATVNGVEIGENAITAYIENFRATNGYDDDESWANFLLDNGYTVDSLRGDTLEYYINQELLRQAADAEGVSVSDEELDEAIESYRAEYDDEQWQAWLDACGYSEASFREYMRLTLLQDALTEVVAQDVAASDEDVLGYVQMYADAYDGAKRVCHILLTPEMRIPHLMYWHRSRRARSASRMLLRSIRSMRVRQMRAAISDGTR